MNKIPYKLTDGKPSFWLDGKEIINPELLDKEFVMSMLKDGDIFPFPDSLEFKEERECKLDCWDCTNGCQGRKVIRLIPKQKEESQDDLWNEAGEMFERYEQEYAVDELKSKFTIQRK